MYSILVSITNGGIIVKRIISILLSISLVFSVTMSTFVVDAAMNIAIYYNDAELTETLHITEYVPPGWDTSKTATGAGAPAERSPSSRR